MTSGSTAAADSVQPAAADSLLSRAADSRQPATPDSALAQLLAGLQRGTLLRAGLHDQRILEGPYGAIADGRLYFDDVADTRVTLDDIDSVWQEQTSKRKNQIIAGSVLACAGAALGAYVGVVSLVCIDCADPPSDAQGVLVVTTGLVFGGAAGFTIGAILGKALPWTSPRWVRLYP